LLCDLGPECEPIDVYNCFLCDDIIKIIVIETNRQALKYKRNWTNTNEVEIKNFLAIVMYTGLVSYPKISDYWSRQPLFYNTFVPKIMPRNRFQELLRFFHVADNDTIVHGDRLGKIQPLVVKLVNNFKKYKVPGENVVIDETMIPFRGRLSFRQYIPSKSARYGVKLFKICDNIGYTYDLIIYSGKNTTSISNDITCASKVVLQLMTDYLNKGRTLIIDNYYTSLNLAHILLSKETHMIGTVRKNSKGFTKDIMNSKLKKGEVKGKEDGKGVVVSIWKDKRDVRMVSTRHGIKMVDTGKISRNGEKIKKPEAIVFYNKNKQGIDVSDQMNSYFTPLRKSIRWYHKVAFQLLLGTSVVNALVMYKELTGKNIQISAFRQQIIEKLIKKKDEINISPSSRKHKLVQTNETQGQSNKKKRRRCVKCYEKLENERGRQVAQKICKTTVTFCNSCENKPAFCLECFQNTHK